MNRRKNELFTDNKGSTLIEIIISVLIVGIAFVPLLMGMSTAFKANTKSESMLFADNVSSKVAEVLKASSSIGEAKDLLESYGTVEGDSTDTSKFYVKKVREGNKAYNVTVEFSSNSTSKNNLSIVNSTSGYKSIGPMSGSRISLYADTAKDYSAITGEITAKKTSAVPEEGLKLLKYIKSKTTILHLSKESATDEDHPNMYHIVVEVEYELDNSGGTDKFTDDEPVTQTAYENWHTSLPESILLFTSSLRDEEKVNIAGANACSNSLYSYFKSKDETIGQKDGFKTNSALSENIEIDNQITNLSDLKVYCFIAGTLASPDRANNNEDETKSGADAYASKMKVNVTNKSSVNNAVSVFCPFKIEQKVGSDSFKRIGSFMEDAVSDDISKMYEVTIKVNGDASNELESALETTVIWN